MKEKFTALYKEFFESEKSGGLILIFCTVFSLIAANTAFQSEYLAFWDYHIGGHSLTHWINDGLMAIFFLLIGLELEREIYVGDLSSKKNAILPIIAAIGGITVPAIIYLCFNWGTDTVRGFGIPTATDIAFALGILSLLGKRVPISLKIFLTALAVIDDLGAILIIAVAYTGSLNWLNLIIALGILAVLFALNLRRIHNLIPYIIGGIAMWYFMLNSGIHPTITGVLLAFAIPFRRGRTDAPSYVLQHYLHKPVAYFILPLFALANTCIVLGSNWYEGFTEPYSLGILGGLIVGKPLGIFLFTIIAVALGIGTLPQGVTRKHIFGIGLLGGIGFTMSIFITLLAFSNPGMINTSKLMILAASLVSGILGYGWLHATLPSILSAQRLNTKKKKRRA